MRISVGRYEYHQRNELSPSKEVFHRTKITQLKERFQLGLEELYLLIIVAYNDDVVYIDNYAEEQSIKELQKSCMIRVSLSETQAGECRGKLKEPLSRGLFKVI